MTIHRKFSFAQFSAIAKRNENDFADLGSVFSFGKSEGSTYTFRDNGSNVLAVAHLDTVQNGAWSSLIRVHGEQILISPRLDDRLGVYIVTSLLPSIGITCDWLLTTGEEIGCSSAEHFTTAKDYKWAFSFDRAGTDVVLYQYDCKALRRLLRKAGFHVGLGSFSDLSFLDIGCSGINFGCGYQDAHSIASYAVLSDTFDMVERFIRFYRKYKNTALPYNPSARWESFRHWQPYGANAYSRAWPDSCKHSDPYAEYLDWMQYGDASESALDWTPKDYLSKDEQLEIIADIAQRSDNEK